MAEHSPDHQPPRWAVRFVEWFCPPALQEQILGDLHENFYEVLDAYNLRRARWHFVFASLRFFKPSILLQHTFHNPLHDLMLTRNYVTTAVRRMRTEKLVSSINILSLAVALASALIIILFIHHETRYDRHIQDHERVVRVTREWFDQDGASNLHLARVAAPIAPLLAENYPEIEQAGRINEYSIAFKAGEEYTEEEIYFTEPAVLDILDLELRLGDVSSALDQPHSVILSDALAIKYFGEENPLGKSMEDADGTQFMVTGVLAPQPVTTHLPVNMLASWSTLHQYFDQTFFENWGGNNFLTYLKLEQPQSIESLESKLTGFMETHDPWRERSMSRLYLQPVTDIHLHSHLDAEAEANGDITTVYVLVSVGLVILILACFNFVSLSTSKALERSREVGVRKVFGAQRRQLIQQFIGEAVITTLAALVLAVAGAYLVLPKVNSLIGRSLSFSDEGFMFLVIVILGTLLITGLLAGLYPALVLSAFKPASVLRGRGRYSTGLRFQKAVVVFQFAITVAMITWVMAMDRQLEYVSTRDLGFDKEQVLILPASAPIRENYGEIKTRLEQRPDVELVTISKFVPASTLVDNVVLGMETDGQMNEFILANISVGHDYFRTYDIEILAGRDFVPGSASDSTQAVMVNRNFLSMTGHSEPDEVIGRTVIWSPGDEAVPMKIIGVVENIHYESLHNEVAPAVFYIQPRYYSRVSVKLNHPDPLSSAESIAAIWQEYLENDPVWFEFVDENLQALYEEEQTSFQLIFYFSLMAIAIACSGLFAMVVHYSEQKRKEMAVRKVMGASGLSITWLSVKRFMMLVIVALGLGLPVGYFVTSEWLESFVLHINPNASLFLLAAVATIALSLITIIYHSIRSALINPAHNLRSE